MSNMIFGIVLVWYIYASNFFFFFYRICVRRPISPQFGILSELVRWVS